MGGSKGITDSTPGTYAFVDEASARTWHRIDLHAAQVRLQWAERTRSPTPHRPHIETAHLKHDVHALPGRDASGRAYRTCAGRRYHARHGAWFRAKRTRATCVSPLAIACNKRRIFRKRFRAASSRLGQSTYFRRSRRTRWPSADPSLLFSNHLLDARLPAPIAQISRSRFPSEAAVSTRTMATLLEKKTPRVGFKL